MMFQKLARDSLIVFITQLLVQLKGLFLLPILTKTFGATNYGIWAQLLVLVGLISPIVVSGLDSANIRFLPGRSKEEIRERFYTNIIYTAGFSFIALFFLWLFATSIASIFFDSKQNAPIVVLAGVFLLLSNLHNMTRNYFRTFLHMKAFSFFMIAEAFCDLVIAILIGVFEGNVYGLVLGLVGIRAVLTITQLLVVISDIGILWPQFSYLKEHLLFGLPLVPTAWFVWALNAADRLFISYYMTLTEVGVYSVNYNLGYMLIGLFFSPIWITFPPLAAQLYNTKQFEKLAKVCRYSIKYALMFMIPAIIGFSMLSEITLNIVATSEFAQGAYLAPWVTLGYLFSMLGAYPGTGFELAKKTSWILVIHGVSALANLALNFILIPPLGLLGAAISTTSAFIIQFLLNSIFGYHFMPFQWDVASILKSLIASALMAVIIYWIHPRSVQGIILTVLAGGIVYFIGLVLLKTFSNKEINLVFEMLKPSGWNLLRGSVQAPPKDP